MAEDRRLLRRVVLRNYKSIAACDVSPAQLTFLVGPNGSGKSNFLDALSFVADSLQHSLDHALRTRGGITEVRRKSSGHPTHFGMRVEFDVGVATGHFAFTVDARKGGGYGLQDEECVVLPRDDAPPHYYRVSSGEVKSSVPTFPAVSPRRLALASASGLPAFRPVYDALSLSGFYDLNPAAIRTMQSPDPGELLSRDGGNVASVLDRIARRSPQAKKMIEEYLGKIVPGIAGVDRKSVGPVETLEFRQRVTGAQHPWRFHSASMSDGTLRAIGLLVALFQTNGRRSEGRSLVGVEEPEAALHPGAAGIIVDALGHAAERKQVLVTSHSADLLDEEEIGGGRVLAVVSEDGITRIGPLDEVGASVLRDHLYAAGELMGMDRLAPDSGLASPTIRQSDLFGGSGTVVRR